MIQRLSNPKHESGSKDSGDEAIDRIPEKMVKGIKVPVKIREKLVRKSHAGTKRGSNNTDAE